MSETWSIESDLFYPVPFSFLLSLLNLRIYILIKRLDQNRKVKKMTIDLCLMF